MYGVVVYTVYRLFKSHSHFMYGMYTSGMYTQWHVSCMPSSMGVKLSGAAMVGGGLAIIDYSCAVSVRPSVSNGRSPETI